MEQQQLLHFCDSKHPLVYRQDYSGGATCCGCQESIYGPIYCCPKGACPWYHHHKSCAEVPLGLHHPLHPLHPLILFDEKTGYPEEKEKSRCQVCKESRNEYTYRCYRCDFNLHMKCAVLQLEPEFHDHPLTPFWRRITFTCNICGKEDNGRPYLCATCCIFIHRSCASLPRRLKVVRHKHPLHITHSSLELNESDSRFCQLCVQKVDTRYGLYYCSKCDFVAHLNCAINRRNREYINLLELKDEEKEDAKLDQSVEFATTYKIKNIKAGEDGIEIATEIEHFSHEHDLKLTDEKVHNNEKCDGCVRAIFPPFYSCANCSFFLHKSCANLPMKKQNPLHQHPLTLRKAHPWCGACLQRCNDFFYTCELCGFDLHVQCSLIPEDAELDQSVESAAAYKIKNIKVGEDETKIATEIEHFSHKHDLKLTDDEVHNNEKCNRCARAISPPFYNCANCSFFLHKSCANLPMEKRNPLHQHPLTLRKVHPWCGACLQRCNDFFYTCELCGFDLHVQCSLIPEDAKLDQSVESATAYKIKNIKVGEDGIEIATEIEHFSHKHHLKLTNEEVHNNEKCDRCARAIFPPFYSCAKCSFFLHKSCANLPMKKQSPLHQHPLTLQKVRLWCDACLQHCNGFFYTCDLCGFDLDVQCSLVPEILTHEGHKHRLILSSTRFEQSCSSCGDRRNQVFRCTSCEFALDFKCATLPQATRYKQHEHPFTLSYTAEDDSGEYYCDICEEERNPNHWFYYCADCTYPAHPKCILGEYPNEK